jgi:hypothetical protein
MDMRGFMDTHLDVGGRRRRKGILQKTQTSFFKDFNSFFTKKTEKRRICKV